MTENFYKDPIFLAISLSRSLSLPVHMFSYPQARDGLFFPPFISLTTIVFLS